MNYVASVLLLNNSSNVYQDKISISIYFINYPYDDPEHLVEVERQKRTRSTLDNCRSFGVEVLWISKSGTIPFQTLHTYSDSQSETRSRVFITISKKMFPENVFQKFIIQKEKENDENS